MVQQVELCHACSMHSCFAVNVTTFLSLLKITNGIVAYMDKSIKQLKGTCGRCPVREKSFIRLTKAFWLSRILQRHPKTAGNALRRAGYSQAWPSASVRWA